MILPVLGGLKEEENSSIQVWNANGNPYHEISDEYKQTNFYEARRDKKWK